MDSSAVIDFSRVPGGRSNFSQTCNRLSQYLKEKRSFGDLNLELNHNKGARTMNLLPMIEKSGQQNPHMQFNDKKDAETAQMTIFYAGQMIVFNDLSSHKANEIMDLARKSSGAAENLRGASIALPLTAQIPAELPIQRKNSLARFLEKRKERFSANAPYQTSKPQPKPVKVEAWLGLGPHQFSHQMQRQ